MAASSTGSEDEDELRWAAIERLPSQQRSNTALVRRNGIDVINVRKLDRTNREFLVRRAFDTTDEDNFKLLSEIKDRLDRVGLEVPKVEVRFENLLITANVQMGSRALPVFYENLFSTLRIFRPKRHALTILNKVSGVVKPGRLSEE